MGKDKELEQEIKAIEEHLRKRYKNYRDNTVDLAELKDYLEQQIELLTIYRKKNEVGVFELRHLQRNEIKKRIKDKKEEISALEKQLLIKQQEYDQLGGGVGNMMIEAYYAAFQNLCLSKEENQLRPHELLVLRNVGERARALIEINKEKERIAGKIKVLKKEVRELTAEKRWRFLNKDVDKVNKLLDYRSKTQKPKQLTKSSTLPLKELPDKVLPPQEASPRTTTGKGNTEVSVPQEEQTTNLPGKREVLHGLLYVKGPGKKGNNSARKLHSARSCGTEQGYTELPITGTGGITTESEQEVANRDNTPVKTLPSHNTGDTTQRAPVYICEHTKAQQDRRSAANIDLNKLTEVSEESKEPKEHYINVNGRREKIKLKMPVQEMAREINRRLKSTKSHNNVQLLRRTS